MWKTSNSWRCLRDYRSSGETVSGDSAVRPKSALLLPFYGSCSPLPGSGKLSEGRSLLYRDFVKAHLAFLTRGFAILLLFSCLTGQALAHDISASFLDLNLEDGTLAIRYRLPVPEMDLMFLLDQNLDGRYDRGEIQQALGQLQEYVNQKLSLQINALPVLFEPQDFAVWGDEQDHLFVDFVKALPMAEPVEQIRIESQLFQELISNHKTMVAIHSGQQASQYALDASNRVGLWQADHANRVAHFVRFLKLGIEHIFTGYDHILFLVGLLLIGSSLLEVVKIVTSFTVAHSLTLGLAVLGHADPNPTLVEVGIAFSIAYIGMENLMKKPMTRRWHITFFFGLVHGFGFAHILREMNLSSAQLASSLFSFNLGVELGQVAIVTLIFPMLKGIHHLSWHHLFLKGASATVLGFGVFWFFQRLLVF